MPDHTAIQSLATRMAGSIQKSKQKKVLVFDFMGPGMNSAWIEPNAKGKKAAAVPQLAIVTALGETLAGDFGAALAESLPNGKISLWDNVYQTLAPGSYYPDVIRDGDTELWMAQTFKFDLFIWGYLETETGGTMKLNVLCYRAKDAHAIEHLQVSLSSTPRMKEMTGMTITESWHTDYPLAEKKAGYTFPRCVLCPEANYSEAAISSKVEGTVEMYAIIATDGHANDVKILRGLPFGLTEQAIKTVQAWRFDPALGPDGKPVAVRQIIEVSFHLY
jgi:TonB family protein